MKGFFKVLNSNDSVAILLFLENRRYLFNCGEGFQRFITQHKVRVGARLDHIFLTSLSWSKVGGLPGLLLTMADTGLKKACITGPKGLQKLWNSTHSFFSRPDCCMEINEAVDYEDDLVRISAFELFPSSSSSSSSSSPSSIAASSSTDSAFSSYSHSSSNFPVCYFCKAVDVKGKFRVDLADALGVPKNQRKIIAKRIPVVLENGTTILPDQIIEPPKPGSRVLILDCPSLDYLESLITNTKLTDCALGGKVDYVFHLAPLNVIAHEKYQSWCSQTFPSSHPSPTMHIMTHESCSSRPNVHSSHSKVFSALSMSNPALFPPLWHLSGSFSIPGLLNENFIPARPLMTLNIEPQRCLEYEEMAPGCMESANLDFIACEINKVGLKLPSLMADDSFKAKITFLGTGCAVPSKHRNVTGIHIEVDGFGMILDGGEGTLNQMIHMFGFESMDAPYLTGKPDPLVTSLDQIKHGFERKLASVSLMCVSHMHADHHLGLVEVIKAYHKIRNQLYPNLPRNRLTLVGPKSLIDWLNAYSMTVGDGCILKNDPDFEFIPSHSVSNYHHSCVQKITAVRVIHCNDSYGYVVRMNNGFKFVFSGDTRPCRRLIEVGMDAHVLIHEATFESSMIVEAKKKNHSTVAEAFNVALDMNVQNLFLTHFSQRYPCADGSSKHYAANDGVVDDLCLSFSHEAELQRLKEDGKFPFVATFAFDGMRWSSSMSQQYMRVSQKIVDSTVTLMDHLKDAESEASINE